MTRPMVERLVQHPRDLALVVLLFLCLMLSVAAIHSTLGKREALMQEGGARKVDLTTVRKQISDGELSEKKALFYRKLPR